MMSSACLTTVRTQAESVHTMNPGNRHKKKEIVSKRRDNNKTTSMDVIDSIPFRDHLQLHTKTVLQTK